MVALDEPTNSGVEAAVVPVACTASMRANSAGIQLQGVVVRGLQRRDLALDLRIRGVDTDDARFPNTAQARLSSRPDRSSATTVLSNVGSSPESTMAATSARCSAIPASRPPGSAPR